MTSNIVKDINYITFDKSDIVYLTLKGYLTRAEPNNPDKIMYHVLTFQPCRFMQVSRKNIQNFNSDVKEPLKKKCIESVFKYTEDKDLRKAYKESGLTFQFPQDNDKNSVKIWAWYNIIKDVNKPLQNWCQFEVRIKQISVVVELGKDSNFIYKVVPKFEINTSIKILYDEEAPSNPIDIDDDDDNSNNLNDVDLSDMDTQPADYPMKREDSNEDNSRDYNKKKQKKEK